ncbi:MAG: hypothetical protein ACF8K1_01295 [Phycisphaerales bacterium JB047]
MADNQLLELGASKTEPLSSRFVSVLYLVLVRVGSIMGGVVRGPEVARCVNQRR